MPFPIVQSGQTQPQYRNKDWDTDQTLPTPPEIDLWNLAMNHLSLGILELNPNHNYRAESDLPGNARDSISHKCTDEKSLQSGDTHPISWQHSYLSQRMQRTKSLHQSSFHK